MKLVDADEVRAVLNDTDRLAERPRAYFKAVVSILDSIPAASCEACEHWDTEDIVTVVETRFSACQNRTATKEFKTRVVSQGWLCPLFQRRLARPIPEEEWDGLEPCADCEGDSHDECRDCAVAQAERQAPEEE